MPESGVGYFYSINSGNGDAFNKIGDAIRAYITRDLTRPPVPAPGALPPDAAEYAGWYEPVSGRNEFIHFLERLAGLSLVRFDGGNMVLASINDLNQPFIPVSGKQLRYVSKKDKPEPIATVALLEPNAEGRFIYMGGTGRRIPTVQAWAEIVLTVLFLLSIVAIVLYAPFWLIGGLIKRRRRPAERAMRLWPLIAALSLLGFVGCFIGASSDIITLLGHLTVWSFGVFLCTSLFGVASVASAIALWLARKQQIRGFVRWFSITVTGALLIGAMYLAYWGVIGMRTWS